MTNNRFLVNIEGGVHHDRQTRQGLISLEDSVKTRILFAMNRLRTRRAVHMNHGGNFRAPRLLDGVGDGHEFGGMFAFWKIFENLIATFCQNTGREWHELRPA